MNCLKVLLITIISVSQGNVEFFVPLGLLAVGYILRIVHDKVNERTDKMRSEEDFSEKDREAVLEDFAVHLLLAMQEMKAKKAQTDVDTERNYDGNISVTGEDDLDLSSFIGSDEASHVKEFSKEMSGSFIRESIRGDVIAI